MNPRERTLATFLLGAVALAVVGFLFYLFYLVPLDERQERIRKATEKDNETTKRIQEVNHERQEIAEWRKLSLPANVSPREYQELLYTLIQRSSIPLDAMDVKREGATESYRGSAPDQKQSAYTSLNFTVQGHTDLPHLLRLLEQFYSQPLLHRIKLVSIGKSKTGTNGKSAFPSARELEFRLSVEAIIVNGAATRNDIVAKNAPPPGNLARLPGAYQAMASKNIFFGPPPAAPRAVDGSDPAASVRLTSLGTNPEGDREVTLVDTTDNMIWYLYPERQRDIKSIFEIKKKGGELAVQGEVTRANDNEVIFRSGEKYYSMHLGQTIAEALRNPLTEAQVKALQPTGAAIDHPIRTAENKGAQ